MAALKYWLWLASLRGLSAAVGGALIEQFGGAERVYLASEADYRTVAGLTAAARTALADKSFAAAETILERCDRLGVRIVTLTDAAYPSRLREIPDPPLVLYVQGKDLPYDDLPVIAIVGSRKPTTYGMQTAEQLGLELARHGALVISGGAAGLDTAALRGALYGGGTVAAVLGCGVDIAYPKENRYLFQDIAAAGALLSEYPPGTEALGRHFPVRNRILSGLSVGVLAVEAGRPSGTLITTRLAGEHNRDVFAVPGPLGSETSSGTNWLIQSNQAKLVTRGWDVMEEYLYRFPGRIRQGLGLTPQEESRRLEVVAKRSILPESAPEPQKKEVDKTDDRAYIDWKDYKSKLTDHQRDVLVALGEKSMNSDELIEKTQIPARNLSAALTILEVSGMVRREAGGRFAATVLLRF